jgi:uncharacterized protein YneR
MFKISKSVVQLYKEEMNLSDGDALQLFVRYAGGSAGGYGLGVNRGTPNKQEYYKEIDGITFFVKQGDEWFFKDMLLDYDVKQDHFICESPAIA